MPPTCLAVDPHTAHQEKQTEKHIHSSLFFLLGTPSPTHPFSSQPCCCSANIGRRSVSTQDTHNTSKDVSECTNVEKYADCIVKPAWTQTLQEPLCTRRTCCSSNKLGSDYLGWMELRHWAVVRSLSLFPMFSPQRHPFLLPGSPISWQCPQYQVQTP